MSRPTILIASGAVVVVLAIGLTQLGGTSAGGGGRAPSLSAAQRRLAGSPPALDAVHHDADRLIPAKQLGSRVKALHGYPIVVNVWGAWCTPCRQEFPVFQRVSAQAGRHVAFLGIDTQDPATAASKFLAAHPLTYPSYQDFDGSLAKGYGLIGTPSTIFYDRSGKKTFLHSGPYRRDADLLADIRRYTSA